MSTKQDQQQKGGSEGQEEAKHTEGCQTEIYSETKAMWCGANVVQCVIRDAVCVWCIYSMVYVVWSIRCDVRDVVYVAWYM